jgi:hypothetical protein
MTRRQAIVTAVLLFGGMCLVLGALAAMMVESRTALTIYGAAVLCFAA